MTHEAYAEAYALAQQQEADAWEHLRGKGGSIGDMIKLALNILEDGGTVRIENHVPEAAEHMCWPVYVLVPARQVAPPSLTLVQGGADKGPA